MTNHCYLLVETPDGNLSKRLVTVAYTPSTGAPGEAGGSGRGVVVCSGWLPKRH